MEILNPKDSDHPDKEQKGKTKGKGKSKGKAGNRKPAITEHHGVMFMYKRELENLEFGLNKYLVD